jgi:hypothetical protein
MDEWWMRKAESLSVNYLMATEVFRDTSPSCASAGIAFRNENREEVLSQLMIANKASEW